MRLNKQHKTHILNAILEETFSARTKALEVAKLALADKVYRDVYDKHLPIMAQLPRHFFVDTSALFVRFGEGVDSTKMETNGSRLKAYNHQWGNIKEYPKDHPLAVKYRELEQSKLALAKDKEKLTSEVGGMLASVNTVQQLLKMWPEAEKWLPAGGGPTPNLPAVKPEVLNDLIARMKEVSDAP